MQKMQKTKYDYLKEADFKEEDALYPEEIAENFNRSDKEKYFDFYDDIKTDIKEDW